MSATLVVFLLLAAALGWLFLGGRTGAHPPTAPRGPADEIDLAELEQAERDVRDAADQDSVRDWGPGTTRPPR
jgi:hypothetical protein